MVAFCEEHQMVQVQPRLASAVRCPHEDWSGMASAAQRRRLQNRINARTHRQRRSPPKKKSASAKKAPLDIIMSFDSSAPSPSPVLPASSSPSPPSSSNMLESLAIQARDDVQRIANFVLYSDNSDRTPFLIRFRKVLAAKTEYIIQHPPSPSTDLLLSVISMNVLRAFCCNLDILSFDYVALLQEEAISPFVANPIGTASTLPTDLQPTALQKTVLHHPVFDIFPDPLLREQILLCRGSYDQDALVRDLVGWPNDEHGDRDGLLVWGQPYRTDSWEASEAFLRRYSALLPGCTSLIASSNRWRNARGESPLRIEELE